jgi:hypothetical protein
VCTRACAGVRVHVRMCVRVCMCACMRARTLLSRVDAVLNVHDANADCSMQRAVSLNKSTGHAPCNAKRGVSATAQSSASRLPIDTGRLVPSAAGTRDSGTQSAWRQARYACIRSARRRIHLNGLQLSRTRGRLQIQNNPVQRSPCAFARASCSSGATNFSTIPDLPVHARAGTEPTLCGVHDG